MGLPESVSPTQVFFLPALTLGESQRQKELNRSMALGHAALVSHHRRRRDDEARFVEAKARFVEAKASLSVKKQQARKQSFVVKRKRSVIRECDVVEETSPSPVVYWGNSDPFSSTPLPMTPRAGQLLDFACTFMIPGLFNARLCGSPSGSRFSRISMFAHNYDGLKYGVFLDVDFAKTIPVMMQDECRGLCFLLINMSALRNLTLPGALEQEHSALQCKTLSTLRKRVLQDQGHLTSVDNILFSISSLFAAAVFSHDLAEATVHGRVVCEQFRRHADLINPHQLIRTVYSDIMLASLFMVPTIFDVSPYGWVSNQVAPHFAPLDPDLSVRRALLKMAGRSSRPIGSSLEEVLISTRLAHCVWSMPHPLWPASLYNHWVFTQHLLLQGRCVNLLVQLRDKSGVSWEDEDERGTSGEHFYWRSGEGKMHEAVDAWVQATVATAIIILLTLFRAGEGTEQRFWRDARSFLKQMRILLDRTLQIVATDQVGGWQERFGQRGQNELYAPLAWAAFVGMLVEVQGTVKRDHSETVVEVAEDCGGWNDGFFLQTLRAQVAILDLPDWASLQAMLQRFVYPEGFVPDCLAKVVFLEGGLRENPGNTLSYQWN